MKTSIGGIKHPTRAGQFSVRFSFDGSIHPELTMQTVSANYDLGTHELNVVLEMPLGATELLNDLIHLMALQTRTPNIFGTNMRNEFSGYDSPCIIIDYLDGARHHPVHSIHCFLDKVASCRVEHDYAMQGTVKVYLDCIVRKFMATQSDSSET